MSGNKRKYKDEHVGDDADMASCFCRHHPSSSSNNQHQKNKNEQDLIAQEMFHLTLQERQKVYEQVHGVEDVLEETDDLLDQGLQDMQQELAKQIKANGSSAVGKVAFLNPKRLQDSFFLLQFLRCEEYNGTRAARRLVSYLSFVHQFFGMHGLLAPRLTMQQHLSAKDQHFLRQGTLLQPMSQDREATDRSGRPMLLFYNRISSEYGLEEMARVYTYLCMKTLQDIRGQRKGVVLLSWQVGPAKPDQMSGHSPAFLHAAFGFYHSMPMKISAVHFCFDDAKLQPIMEFAKMAVGKHGRVRFRPHFGSVTECSYSLLSFGIDVLGYFPFAKDNSGHLVLEDYYANYIRKVQEEEEEQTTTSTNEIIPKDNDILLGRGIPFREFPGNLQLSHLVHCHWQDYCALAKNEKFAYCRSMTQGLLQSNVRFLKRIDKNSPWCIVSEEEAIQKVVYTFRNKPAVQRYHAERSQWQ